MKTIAEVEEWYDRYVKTEGDREVWLHRAKTDSYNGPGYCRRARSLSDEATYLVTDAEGNVMRSVTVDYRDPNRTSMNELVEWVFSQGKEKEWFITRTRTQVEEWTVFDPDVLATEVEERITDATSRREQYITEIRRKHEHYERWRQACAWAKENGVQYVSERYNKYDTIKRNVIKAGLVEKWNELYPEFAIKGDY